MLQISYAKVKGIHKYTINHRVTPQINVQITVAKKPTRCHMLSFISPLQAAQHVSGNICPSSGTDCMALLPLVGTVPWLQEGCQNRLAASVYIEEFVGATALTSVGPTKEVRAISSVISAVRCR